MTTPHDAAKGDDVLLSADAVSKQYGVCVETVRRWMRKGVIPYVMVGPNRAKRIRRDVADKLFQPVEAAKN